MWTCFIRRPCRAWSSHAVSANRQAIDVWTRPLHMIPSRRRIVSSSVALRVIVVRPSQSRVSLDSGPRGIGVERFGCELGSEIPASGRRVLGEWSEVQDVDVEAVADGVIWGHALT